MTVFERLREAARRGGCPVLCPTECREILDEIARLTKLATWGDECDCCGEYLEVIGPVADGDDLPCGCGIWSCDAETSPHTQTDGCEIEHEEGKTDED